MKKALVLICARKNSKEIPNKNLIKFNGKTLIEHSVRHAHMLKKKFSLEIICSTDSIKMAKIAKKAGARVPFIRPASLARNNSPEWLVWQHAINFLDKNENYNPDIFISLSPTAPLRQNTDIIKCINSYLKGDNDIVVSVHKSKVNPYFNMLEKNKFGRFELCKKLGFYISNRQKSPKVFSMNTVAYVSSPDYIKKNKNMFSGKVGICEIKDNNFLDLDTKEDLKFLKSLEKK